MLTVAQAAKRIGLTREMVYIAIRSGRIPSEKIDGVMHVSAENLERYNALRRKGVRPGRPRGIGRGRSKYVGVLARGDKWVAVYYSPNTKEREWLGTCETEEQAARLWNKRALEDRGPGARINVIEEEAN